MMMMRRTSPPKHRHDGTSPLPLGMDWCPPPKKWNGPDTIWPHDPRTGWSYCITIPSWVALPKSSSSASDPVVFYRVQVGVQSPDGVTSTRALLRRFNDFLKLYSDLRRAFPKKSLPSAPPKGLLRMRSKALLDERRCSLEEWMTKLLSDIDISRSAAVASFLELEAAARSSFQDVARQPAEADPAANSNTPSQHIHASSSYHTLGGSSSFTTDYGSDTIYETSDLGSPSLGRDDSSEGVVENLTLDDDMSNPIETLVKYGMSNIDEGLLMGESILDQLEGLPKHKVSTKSITDNGSSSKDAHLAVNSMNNLFEAEISKEIGHARRPSNESVESDFNSYKGSERSNSWNPNMLNETTLDFPGGSVASTLGSPGFPESQARKGAQIIIPIDQQPKLNRVLVNMQRRLVTAKTDMEDLITRLNQEIAVKEYLTTKVNDLEVEVETTKHKSKETLQQALLIEKERVTKMQWDMEELRQKSIEMEFRLKSQEDGQLSKDSTSTCSSREKDNLLKKLDVTREQLNSLLKLHEELEVKSKSDIKVLVKEVKSLRRSKDELKQQLDLSLQEKSKLETFLQLEKQRNDQALAARRKLLHDCEVLCSQLRESSVKYLKDNSSLVDGLAIPNSLDLLAKSDNQIGRLLAEVKHFGSDEDNRSSEENNHNDCDDLRRIDNELRKILKDIITDGAKLRKQVNIFIRSSLGANTSPQEDGEEDPSGETVLEQLLDNMSSEI